ncbi:TonB-dependent receptor [Halocola ammonii]
MTRLLTIFLVLFSSFASAQTTISGIVTDQKGNSLPGVNIYLKDTYDGASSDGSGQFRFSTSENGTQLLVFSAMGYKKVEQEIDCSGEPIELKITLKEKINELTAATIVAGSMEASDEKKNVVFSSLDIVTTPGAMGDVVGAMSTLPGASTVGNDGRLFVRGGSASETGIYFDGMRVSNAYGSRLNNVPTRSRFNANLFKGSFFSAGGYSAEFGQALSSTLALNTIDMPVRDQTDLGFTSVGPSVSHTEVFGSQAVTGSVNYTNLQPYMQLVDQNLEFDKMPRALTGEALYRNKVGKNGLFKSYYSYQQSEVAIYQPQPGSEDSEHLSLDNRYHFANANYRHLVDEDWTLFAGLSYSDNKDDLSQSGTNLERLNTLLHAKISAERYFSDRVTLLSGVEWYRSKFEDRLTDLDQSRGFTNDLFTAFSEAKFYLSQYLVFRTGFRAEHDQLTEEVTLAPRFSMAWKVNEHGQFSLAGGSFYQNQEDEYRTQLNSLEAARADHYMINYLHTSNGRTFRAELFHKNYDQLLTFSQSPEGQLENLSAAGAGYAQGFDLFWRDSRTVKNTDYWITYSFIESEREYRDFEEAVQPSFSPKHNFSVVVKHWIEKLNSQLGAGWSWNDGLPYDNPNLPGEMESKSKAYSSFNLNWSYLPKPNLIIHLACSNVFGRENVFGYRYADQPGEGGQFASMPIDQTADRFFFLGVFLTLSDDEKANQLNNL